jgi:hypothetical protein
MKEEEKQYGQQGKNDASDIEKLNRKHKSQ